MNMPEYGAVKVNNNGTVEVYSGMSKGFVPIKEAIERLQEYEDTGVSPEWVRGVVTEQRERWESACAVQRYEIDNAKQGKAPGSIIKQMEDNLASLEEEEEKEKVLGSINAAENKKARDISESLYDLKEGSRAMIKRTENEKINTALEALGFAFEQGEKRAWCAAIQNGLLDAKDILDARAEAIDAEEKKTTYAEANDGTILKLLRDDINALIEDREGLDGYQEYVWGLEAAAKAIEARLNSVCAAENKNTVYIPTNKGETPESALGKAEDAIVDSLIDTGRNKQRLDQQHGLRVALRAITGLRDIVRKDRLGVGGSIPLG